MLSFFSKKKSSPNTPPDNVIQGREPKSDAVEDFIFVENRNSPATVVSNTPYPQIPQLPQGFFGSNFPIPPTSAYPPSIPAINSYPPYPPERESHKENEMSCSAPYLEGVPFELSTKLTSQSKLEAIDKAVDEILASVNKNTEHEFEYDFVLERTILQQYPTVA